MSDPHEQYTNKLGMWCFLASEVMIFGALFTTFSVYHHTSPHVFDQASHHMNLVLGSLNTAVLLTSSLTMALAIQRLQRDQHRASLGFLVATILLGLAFLGIKAIEYTQHIHEHLVPGPAYVGEARAQMYFYLYFLMTGVHAIHMLIGVAVASWMALAVWRRRLGASHHEPLELTGLYWHFVDIVWLYLFPVFYLPGMHVR